LLNSPHQRLTLYHPVEIQTQITPEEAEVPEPEPKKEPESEPKERNVTVSKLIEVAWPGQNSENVSSNEQRATTTGQGITGCLLAKRRF
jgi:hypothetical protein